MMVLINDCKQQYDSLKNVRIMRHSILNKLSVMCCDGCPYGTIITLSITINFVIRLASALATAYTTCQF